MAITFSFSFRLRLFFWLCFRLWLRYAVSQANKVSYASKQATQTFTYFHHFVRVTRSSGHPVPHRQPWSLPGQSSQCQLWQFLASCSSHCHQVIQFRVLQPWSSSWSVSHSVNIISFCLPDCLTVFRSSSSASCSPGVFLVGRHLVRRSESLRVIQSRLEQSWNIPCPLVRKACSVRCLFLTVRCLFLTFLPPLGCFLFTATSSLLLDFLRLRRLTVTCLRVSCSPRQTKSVMFSIFQSSRVYLPFIVFLPLFL
jgi:hypothetical protein